MKKREFFVLYDYGQGGVWAVLRARSREAIQRAFPALQIFEQPPRWMSKDEVQQIKESMSFDLDRPTGWLARLRAETMDKRTGDARA